MGALLDASGRVVNLPGHLLIGRGQAAGLRLTAPSVSTEHAVLAWRRCGWRLRDLGSANGTFINGQRIAPGDDVNLNGGDLLGFAATSATFQLVDAGPPRAFAQRLRDGLQTVGSSEVLGLPSPSCPTLQIMPMGAGWVLSSECGDHTVSDGEVIVAGGESWRLSLPGSDDDTQRPSHAALVQQLQLRFQVSPDEETVLIELRLPRGAVQLESRAHNYLLLHLARQRLKDATLPRREQGWLERATLASHLHLDPEHLNVQLFRIRRAFAEAGVMDAGNLVECRRRPGQVRIGVSDLQIAALNATWHPGRDSAPATARVPLSASSA